VLEVGGYPGRCALTTRQPETRVVDFKTLHVLRANGTGWSPPSRRRFGVHPRVVSAGRVRVGDLIAVAA
jgi:uncharacterized protein YcbX